MVKAIRSYKDLKDCKDELRAEHHSEDGIHTQAARTTENIALRLLSPREEQILDAIDNAIIACGRQQYGGEIISTVQLVDWQGLTQAQASYQLHMDISTVKRRRTTFINLVAKGMGYL